MKSRIEQDKKPYFVETPVGIFTMKGNWFHTSLDKIKQYAPGLTDIYSYEKLIKDSEVWCRSADPVTLIIFMGLTYFWNAYIGGIIALVFFFFWHFNKSAFISYHATRVMKLLDYEFVVIIITVAVLSIKGMNGAYIELIIGFVYFFFLKFGWLRSLVDKWYDSRKKVVTLNDRVLKMIILQYALYEGIKVKDIENWESDIYDLIHGKQKENKGKK
ncbi:MAG TPA: hypothetical protein VE912_07650 [Bacteroidales bacterium]|nr:hypothetical protein [Bacteroidales bacterium]